jgi:hypothetical protein
MAVGLVIVKQFTYRGDATEEFSNDYHFTGATPADATAWKALADALITQEKTCYTNGARVVRAYGYDSDAANAHAVWSWDYLANATTVAGTMAQTGGQLPAGDQAAQLRWKTSRLNTKGKPIYLRKYFHAVPVAPAAPDYVLATAVTALGAFGGKMRDGTFLDARTLTARGHTDTLVSHLAGQFITTRTLKRRGKRPPTA